MPVLVSAVVLAAGESKRMGEHKQLLLMGSRTMLERVLDSFIASSVCQVVAVLGSGVGKMRKVIGNRAVDVVFNERYQEGMSTSLIKGLEAVNRRAGGVMFALVDQPFVDTDVINRLIAAFSCGSKGIVVPVYGKRRGNPVLFDMEYGEELRGLRGDRGAKEILMRHPEDVLEVDVECSGVIEDIDTVEEYRRACEEFDAGYRCNPEA